ncbi:trk system potassium uptake protein TrkA [Acetitomaculum ruminis DSM 5522]|uniref:Trk system potassium uptake protein TrkA n=1 Tax=Acetitomaculum ruminis DSM 5522 TaxID=1120918 RepID=A0A1I0XTZ6_9FIRM|nr:Trk system potassium transporter TrkA [Acetitomaculum ruminis]SFB03730.1 trk system potassium uptake protein TrkA [Acetitomaculum ruminis DSM 5522]
MRIVIAGCGKIGSVLVEQLSKEDHDVSIIDTNKEVVDKLSNQYDVMGVIGNAAVMKTQKDAGIEDADLLIAMTGSDELNLICCLIAKKVGNCNTIARIQNTDYAEGLDAIKKELGLSMTINPEKAAAEEIVRVIRFPSAMQVETFAKTKVEIVKVRLEEGHKLIGLKLVDLPSKINVEALVCAVERGEEAIIPKGDFVFQQDDVVSIVASPKKARVLFKKLGILKGRIRNVMIVGGGGISFYVAKALNIMGIANTIIEKNPERCRKLCEELPGSNIIEGDAVDQSVLYEEGVDKVGAFVAMTNIDEGNILMSLYVKKHSHAKLITKIHRIRYNEILNNMDLGTIVCPKNIVSDNILSYVRARQNSFGSNVETLYKILDGKAEALEFIVRSGSKVVGIPLQKLNIRKDMIVACIQRGRKVIIPRGQDVINEGDSIIIVTTKSGINELDNILDTE